MDAATVKFDVLGHEIIDDFRGKYFFLSNFYLREMVMYGITFHSSEQAYMWHKTLIQAEKDAILAAPTPREVKEIGGPPHTTLRPDWDEIRVPTMVEVLDCKYNQHPDLKQRLLDTDESLLIEGNWWHDNFWGDCRCGKKEECKEPGLNHLGKSHMFLRHKYSQ